MFLEEIRSRPLILTAPEIEIRILLIYLSTTKLTTGCIVNESFISPPADKTHGWRNCRGSESFDCIYRCHPYYNRS